MSKNLIQSTDFNGNFIKEMPSIKVFRGTYKKDGTPQYTLRRQVKLKCLNTNCGKEFIIDLSNALRTKQKCCSRRCNKEMNFYFGIPNEQHPLYSRWLSMIQRCTTHNKNVNHRYGGRGISVETFFKKFTNYADYVMNLPNCPKVFPSKMQLDRINNDGNYERGNLRWVNASDNMANAQQPKKKYHDKYIGVTWSNRKKRYCVRLRHNKVTHFLGWFDNELEGAKVREDYIKKHNLPNKLNHV